MEISWKSQSPSPLGEPMKILCNLFAKSLSTQIIKKQTYILFFNFFSMREEKSFEHSIFYSLQMRFNFSVKIIDSKTECFILFYKK